MTTDLGRGKSAIILTYTEKLLLIRYYRLIEINEETASESSRTSSPTTQQRPDNSDDIAKPLRPKEFSIAVGIPLVSLFAMLSAALVVVFIKARIHGKPNRS